MANQLERQSKQLERSLTTVQGRLEEVIGDLKPLGEMAETVHTQITDIGETLHSRAGDVDQFVEEVLQLGREQASKVDYLVTDTVQKFEETTEVIQRDVLQPAIEISSLVRGVKAGLDVLLSRKSSRSKDGSKDEEMFI
jgi:chromosome segregation ATPase